jgi:hypothetical protein
MEVRVRSTTGTCKRQGLTSRRNVNNKCSGTWYITVLYPRIVCSSLGFRLFFRHLTHFIDRHDFLEHVVTVNLYTSGTLSLIDVKQTHFFTRLTILKESWSNESYSKSPLSHES